MKNPFGLQSNYMVVGNQRYYVPWITKLGRVGFHDATDEEQYIIGRQKFDVRVEPAPDSLDAVLVLAAMLTPDAGWRFHESKLSSHFFKTIKGHKELVETLASVLKALDPDEPYRENITKNLTQYIETTFYALCCRWIQDTPSRLPSLAFQDQPLYMTSKRGNGGGDTIKYTVMLVTTLGRVGHYSMNSNDDIEIRVEPANSEAAKTLADKLTQVAGWEKIVANGGRECFSRFVPKQDDFENPRFSSRGVKQHESMTAAIKALLPKSGHVLLNTPEDVMLWIKELVKSTPNLVITQVTKYHRAAGNRETINCTKLEGIDELSMDELLAQCFTITAPPDSLPTR